MPLDAGCIPLVDEFHDTAPGRIRERTFARSVGSGGHIGRSSGGLSGLRNDGQGLDLIS